MNNKVISFPHLSNYDVPIKYLIEKLNRRYLYNEFLNKLLEECQK